MYKVVVVIFVSISLVWSVFCQAQTQNEIDNGNGGAESVLESILVEQIVVTGTRLQRDSYSTAAPLIAFDKEEITSLGSNDLSELLLEIPGVTGASNLSNNAGNFQNNGLTTIDLRNLGSNRSLVLIDGRRTVSNSISGNRISLGTIPLAFVERLEVITGGASSVYGSDAVAGVVNIITETDKEGFELSGRYGEGREGAYDESIVDISFGKKFGEGRGYFLVTGSYDDESGILSTDVDRALIQANWDYEGGVNRFETVGGAQPASGLVLADLADLSSNPEGGRFGFGGSRDFWYDKDNQLQGNFVSNRDGFDTRRDIHIRTPRERLNFAFKASYQIGASMEFFSHLMHSKTDTDTLRAPEPDDYNDPHRFVDPLTGLTTEITSGAIPLTNPFVPAGLKNNTSNPAQRDITWDRRFSEVGPQRTLNDRQTTRAWVGLRGDIFGNLFSNWTWETTLGVGQYKQDQVRFNEVNIVRLRKGLNADLGADGLPRCADEQDRAEGCVAVDLFGRGSITPQAADYIRANLAQEATVDQINFQGYLSGTAFDLPSGEVRAVLGFEYREDSQDVKPSEATQVGGDTANFVPAFSGSIDVAEIFGELEVPLVKDAPGIAYLNWKSSARLANYSIDKVGSVTSFGTSLEWSPVGGLDIRASFNRALRAPDLSELFSPPRGDSDNFDDICDGVGLNTEGIIAENCRAEPTVLANIPEGETFDQNAGSKFAPNAGNLDLFEEAAETLTVGFVWQPGFLSGFNLSVDYYNIEIDDVIGRISASEILAQCYESENNFGADNFFCQQITRDSDGQIISLVQRELNLDSAEVNGIDASMEYRFTMNWLRLPGDFRMRYIHSHLTRSREVVKGDDGLVIFDTKGDLTSGNFIDRGRFSLQWKHKDFLATWRVKYYGTVNDSNVLIDAYNEALITNPNAEVPRYLDLPQQFVHDLSASYGLTHNDMRYHLSLGVRNVFDNDGPFLPEGTNGGLDNQDTIYGTGTGRLMYLGFKVYLD